MSPIQQLLWAEPNNLANRARSYSTSGHPHLRPRHPPWSFGLVLPLHFPPSSTYFCTLLGFFAPQRRSAAHFDFQDQYFPTARVDRSDNVRTSIGRTRGDGGDGVENQLVGGWGDNGVEWRELYLGKRCCEDTD